MFRPLLADERFAMLYDVQRAAQITDGCDLDNLYIIAERAEGLKSAVLLPPPLLNGNEIISLGAKAGPQVGEISRRLYLLQLDNAITTKEAGRRCVKQAWRPINFHSNHRLNIYLIRNPFAFIPYHLCCLSVRLLHYLLRLIFL